MSRFLIALAIYFCGLLTGCQQTSVSESEIETAAECYVARVKSYCRLKQSKQVNPDDSPDDGDRTCDVCGGTGVVGDGRIEKKCGTCGGDGTIDGNERDGTDDRDSETRKKKVRPYKEFQIVAKRKSGTYYILVSGPNCGACKTLKRKMQSANLPVDVFETSIESKAGKYFSKGQTRLPVLVRVNVDPPGRVDYFEACTDPGRNWNLFLK